ncbi:MAG: hypothetical protein U1E78_00875 [Gammaproteobacteria bacterium]
MDMTMLQNFERSLEKAVHWFEANLNDEGALLGSEPVFRDYAAIPYLFSLMGRLEKAHRILHYVQKEYLRHHKEIEFDSHVHARQLSSKDELSIAIGWVAHAAHRMGRFEISIPLFQYLRQFYEPEQGAFTARAPRGEAEAVLDFFSTAFLGWVSLYGGDLVKAQRAGNYLQRSISLQPDIRSSFYLRMDDNGRFITAFESRNAYYHVISRQKERQAYAALGFAVGVLGKIYAATSDANYLMTAKSCLESVQGLSEGESDIQIAWGASVLANLTKESRFIELATVFAEKVVAEQVSDGAWQSKSAPFIETANNAIWLAHIVAELSEV